MSTCLSVVIPAYNEEATLVAVTQKILAVPHLRDVVIVDDCSSDRTGEIADQLELGQPSVSKHLQVLLNVDLVTVRRDGRRTLYRTNSETLRTIHDWSGMFAQHWRGQLRRIKAHAEGNK